MVFPGGICVIAPLDAQHLNWNLFSFVCNCGHQIPVHPTRLPQSLLHTPIYNLTIYSNHSLVA